MFGMQTASGVRKLLARQIRCKAPTLLKWLQTWSLASFKLGRILDPENTVTRSFSTLSAAKRTLSARSVRNEPAVQGAGLALLNPYADQVPRQVMSFGETVQRLKLSLCSLLLLRMFPSE